MTVDVVPLLVVEDERTEEEEPWLDAVLELWTVDEDSVQVVDVELEIDALEEATEDDALLRLDTELDPTDDERELETLLLLEPTDDDRELLPTDEDSELVPTELLVFPELDATDDELIFDEAEDWLVDSVHVVEELDPVLRELDALLPLDVDALDEATELDGELVTADEDVMAELELRRLLKLDLTLLLFLDLDEAGKELLPYEWWWCEDLDSTQEVVGM